MQGIYSCGEYNEEGSTPMYIRVQEHIKSTEKRQNMQLQSCKHEIISIMICGNGWVWMLQQRLLKMRRDI